MRELHGEQRTSEKTRASGAVAHREPLTPKSAQRGDEERAQPGDDDLDGCRGEVLGENHATEVGSVMNAVITGNVMLGRLLFLVRGMKLGMKGISPDKAWRSGRRRLSGRSWFPSLRH